MNPGLAYLVNYMDLTENTLNICVWAINTGIALTVLAHGIRWARGLTNVWVSPAPLGLSINILGDLFIFISIGILCYGAVISFI